MGKHLLLAILIIFLSLNSILKSQTTVSIRLGPQTGKDVVIGDNYLNQNFENHPDLLATGWTNQGVPVVGRSLFQFYWSIPNNATILDARLSLYGNPTPVNPNHYGLNRAYLRRIVSPWNAYTVTWSTQPDYITTHQVLLPESSYPLEDYLNINVTDLVRDMINYPTMGYGFIFMLNTEWLYRCMNFASSECADTSKRPLLHITYTTLTGIKSISNGVPENYKIYQNYPNPFNPTTNIKFDIPKNTFARILIFDMLGRELESLVNQNLEAGSYNISWDASKYSSGEYFYKIVASDFVENKKMTLLK